MSGVANQSMEPTGVERHRRSPQGERAGASEWSQRAAVRHRRSKAEVADRELGSSSQSIEVRAISVKPAGVWARVSAIDSNGRTIWIVDAHRDDGKRFAVHATEKLTAFVELEAAIRAATQIP